MATKTRNGKVESSSVDWRSGAQASNMMGTTYRNAQIASKDHVGLLDYYMPKFYSMARGHVINKYHVGLYGPYVDEALRVMDQNSIGDKYDYNRTKPFPGTTDNFRKTLFDQWLSMCYEKDTGVLNMFWAAKSISINSPTATTQNVMMDTTKSMSYPVITSISCENTMTIEVIDDPYLMWYNFFNALFNVQFSPLLLKPRSTLQKINVMVELLTEGITVGNSMKSIEERENGNPCMTDAVIGQMFEFNSCITTRSPAIQPNYESSNPYSFQVELKYPNAFQGTFKDQMRYLRDNTTRGVDPSKQKAGGETGCEQSLKPTRWNPYGDYNVGFFEATRKYWMDSYDTARYEAFQPAVYMKYARTGKSAFPNVKYNYDMHGKKR